MMEHNQAGETEERRVVVATIIIFSFAHFAVLSARSPLLPGLDDRVVATLGERAGVMIAAGFLCYGLFHLIRSNRASSVSTRVALGVFLCAPAGTAIAYLNRLFYNYRFDEPKTFSAQDLDSFIIASLYWFWYLVAWCGIYLAIAYSFEVRDRERRLAAAQSLAHAAQLRALRYQVNPHFLFNTLNSIASLIADGKNKIAEDMLLTMSDFFRTSLRTDPLEDSSLGEEMRLQSIYLAIEQLRFQDRLILELSLPRALEDALVPSLILQPLVENAIKHGVARSSGPVLLSICATAGGGRLTLAVENDAPESADANAGLGVGLRNVQDRIITRFGDTATFTAVRTAGKFRVEFSLPLERRLNCA